MPENSRSGREPIAIVQLDQDVCSRTWGQGLCYAGLLNLVYNSTDLTDTNNWTVSNYTITDGVADPLGGTDAIELTSTDTSSSYVRQVKASQDLSEWFDTAYIVLYAKAETAGVEQILITQFGVPNTQARIDLTDGSILYENGFTDVTVTDEGSGWYKIVCEDDPADLASGQLQIQFLDSSVTSPPVNDKGRIYGLMVCADPDQRYRPTSGQAAASLVTEPCFNTRATCTEPDSYDKTTLSLKFCKNRSPLPTDDYYLPYLAAVSSSPAAINPGGAKKSTSPFGKRATFRATLIDAPHDDKLVDPYRDQRDYTPIERGTFWTKWRARNPYYLHRKISFISGYLKDGEIVDSITREFVITGFDGPDSNGHIEITGKDILTLAEGSKAQAPRISTGELAADITDTATSATLAPSGIGDLEYPASGTLRIEKEVIPFTRSGDTLTLTTRGTSGTEAKAHETGAAVQLVLDYSSESPQDILYDLLNDYAGIPASYLDTTQWNTETLDYLPRLYSAIIAEPEDVSKLVGEMCEQMYFTVYYDERDAKVRIRAIRSAEDDEITSLDDFGSLIKDSITWRDLTDELITQVWVYYGQINPTLKLDQADNYSAVYAATDTDSESAERNGTQRIKKVFSRWIDATNSTGASDLAARIIGRYGGIPRECSFSLDAKNRDIWLGDFVEITNRLNVDKFGLPKPTQLQIQQAQESALGSVYSYIAQEFISGEAEAYDPNERNIDITTNLLNVNLRTLHDSLFGAPTSGDTVTFRVKSGIIVGGDAAGGGTNVQHAARTSSNDFYDAGNNYEDSTATGTVNILQRQGLGSQTTYNAGDTYPSGQACLQEVREYPVSTALETGSWPAGVNVKLIVETGAMILGEGGNGSAHTMYRSGTTGIIGIKGGDGGHALSISNDIEITNYGLIAGGGGGGTCAAGYGWHRAAPGGGGAGYRPNSLSSIRLYPGDSSVSWQQKNPQPGDTLRGGGGGGFLFRNGDNDQCSVPYIDFPAGERSGDDIPSGAGGDLAQDGDGARMSYFDGSSLVKLEDDNGGTAGDAIAAGASSITWITKGDVRGAENG